MELMLAILLIAICVSDSFCTYMLSKVEVHPKTLIHLIPGVSIYRYMKFKQKLKESNSE